MSKIQKFLASALNNSSANEAAAALKRAAHMMQEEGINPRSLLQAKGDANAFDLTGLSKILTSVRLELTQCKADYNGMVERYNTVVRAYKARGEKITALEAELEALRKTAPEATRSATEAANYNSPYGAIIKDLEAEKAAQAVNSRKFHKLCEVFSNLKGIEDRINGGLHLSEPDGLHANGVIYVFTSHASGGTDYAIYQNDDSEDWRVTVYEKGKRGGSKGTQYLAFDSENAMMRALFKFHAFLK
ncbi:hypothetical protein FER63_23460 [Salmonella enterica]|nr:hypothetical protein [Salmonella enterica]